MTDKQATIFGTKEPVANHISDMVECSDGSECSRCEALEDCVGGYHRTDEARHDADVLAVTDVLDVHVKWAEEYCTENEDYADGYACIVDEASHRWDDPVGEWVGSNWDDVLDTDGGINLDECIRGEIAAMICEALDGSSDCDLVPNPSDYGNYVGDGCCLDGFKIEEYEDQVDIDGCDELEELHDRGALDDVLDDVRCDAYVCRSRRREKVKCHGCNELIGSAHKDGCTVAEEIGSDVTEDDCYYESVGRETYMPYDRSSKHPNFLIHIGISGGWDFVVSKERMTELLYEALVKWAGYDD